MRRGAEALYAWQMECQVRGITAKRTRTAMCRLPLNYGGDHNEYETEQQWAPGAKRC